MWVEVFLSLFFVFLLTSCLSKPVTYPPGNWGLPLIGYIPLNKKTFDENLLELREKNGNSPILLWRMGTKLVIFLFENELIREAFTNKMFAARPKLKVLGFNGNAELGLLVGNGIAWENSRRFTLYHLRKLRMGKSSLVPVIQNEAAELVKDLKVRAGKPTKLPDSITVAALNVLWQMVGAKRYTSEEAELKRNFFFRKQTDNALLVDLFPWLLSVLPKFILKVIWEEDREKESRLKLKDMLMAEIDEHKKTLDPDNPKDYIDAYLTEMKKREHTLESTFSDDDLVCCISDLLGAGSKKVSFTLQWMLLYIACHPHVQKRMQKEIDEVLPKGTLVNLEDRQRLPFTEAVIHEVLRHCNFIKYGIFHMTTQDTRLGGYDIPKGAIISRVSHWTNYDPKVWDVPNEFRPERFLDTSGKFSQPKEGFFPFNIGKRACVGESLARMEYLVFITSILQNIKLEVPCGEVEDVITPIACTFLNFPDPEKEILMTIR